MKKFLGILLVFTSITLSVLADGKQDALNFFNNYVKAANSYSTAIPSMYSPNAKIIRQVIKPDGTTANAVTDTATYMKQLRLSQSVAKMRKYKNTYTNINVTALPNGSYKVSAIRSPMNDNDNLKTYMIISKVNGKLLITEEMMQTRQQVFLKYAK
ncbi:MAG: hypothetical protein MJ237_00225 [bacterium]|nr:hypothetical protein [bacterium]